MKNSDKSRYVCSGYGIGSDGAGSWSFANDFARKFVIFGVDNSSSSRADNRKNNFLVMEGERLADDINGNVDTIKKKFSFNFTTAETKFCLSLHYNGDTSYLFVNRKEIYKFRVDDKNVNFSTQFCLRSVSEKFAAV